LCAQPLNQVNINENPAFPGLCTWNFTRTRFCFERMRVNSQEGGGLI
jgi:hypothetical protein